MHWDEQKFCFNFVQVEPPDQLDWLAYYDYGR